VKSLSRIRQSVAEIPRTLKTPPFKRSLRIPAQSRISEHFGRLPSDLELAVFRIVQECLTNIHRHSGSKTASIRLDRQPESMTIEIRDQGKGMTPDRLAEIQSEGSGVGIRGIRERLHQFKGQMNIESDNSGTRILVSIPIPKYMTFKGHGYTASARPIP
jgi:signal transduction histidine kinase